MSEKKWPFTSSILLEKKRFDAEKLAQDLLRDWNINPQLSKQTDPNALVFEYEGMLCTVTYMPARVPRNEATEAAKYNKMFPGAVRVANTHKAHILVAILGKHQTPKEMGIILVKISTSCLKQEYATGIYTAGTVFNPEFYVQAAASSFANGQYPVANLIFTEVYSRDGGKTASVDTYGMGAFGKREMEVLDSNRTPQQLMTLMYDMAFWLIHTDGELVDGETIEYKNNVQIKVEFTHDERLDIDVAKLEY